MRTSIESWFRVGFGFLAAAVLAPVLLVCLAALVTLVEGGPVLKVLSLAPFYGFLGGMILVIPLAVLVVPVYLVARWRGRDTPMVAIVTGAGFGGLLLGFLGELLFESVLLGSAVGALTGFVFLRIVGPHHRNQSSGA